MTTTTKDRVRQFILSMPQFSKDANLTDDLNLFEKGIVESVNAINLVIFLENEFGIQISSGDLVGDNFQSVNHILAFIDKKKRTPRD